MSVDEIKKLVRSFPKHIAILAVLSVSVFFYFDAKRDQLLKLEIKLYEEKAQLKQKELELTAKSKSNEAFYGALKEFRSRYGAVDLSTEIQCDEPSMNRYRETVTNLNILEGMAKETGRYQSYEKFFREKRGLIHVFKNACDKESL